MLVAVDLCIAFAAGRRRDRFRRVSGARFSTLALTSITGMVVRVEPGETHVLTVLERPMCFVVYVCADDYGSLTSSDPFRLGHLLAPARRFRLFYHRTYDHSSPSVLVMFACLQPEPDFESEGIAELLGIESGPASKGDIGDGRGNGMESFVPVTLHAGSYRLPAEAFLHPSQQVPITWAGFQNVWSGLPFTHAFPVETTCQRRTGASTVAVKGTNVSDSARTVRRAMLAKDGSFGGRTSSLAAATVACPIGASDYAMSIAWAFEAWDGTPVLCSLTAMKAPFSFAQPSRGHANGAAHQVGEEQASWFGRMEVRCGSCACADFAQSSSARLARFVTNRVFETSSPAGDVSQQTDPTTHDASFSKMFMPSSLPLGRSGVNDAHPDWFSRTDTSMPLIPRGSEGQHSPVGPSLPKKFSGRGATNVAKMSPLDRAVKDKAPVDTMSAISSAW